VARHAGPEPPVRTRVRELGRWLRVLAGVDERLLDKVPSERARYTALGGVVLGTATIAAFSMSMALNEVLGGFHPFTVVLVLVWGLFVLNLDRWLVSSSAGSQWHRRAAIFLPRLLLAVFFGIVIAEPLVLRVFQTAIEEQVRTERQQELTDLASTLTRCNPPPTAPEPDRAAATSPDCADFRISFESTPWAAAAELAAKQRDAERLQETIQTQTEQQAMLDELARNECAGTAGPGLTGRPGRGAECLRREREADDYRRGHRTSETIEELRRLRGEIDQLQSDVNSAQTSYQSALDTEIDKQVAERRSHHGPIGLLERFQTLHDLVATNSFLTVASWLIRLLFIVVDCLPVLVKFFGGTTHYDRLVDQRLASAERVHRETVRTTELAITTNLEVEQHKVTSQAHQRRAEIDLETRRHEAGIDASISRATDALTEQLVSRRSAGVAGNGRAPKVSSPDAAPPVRPRAPT
jgi:hypothetical protein